MESVTDNKCREKKTASLAALPEGGKSLAGEFKRLCMQTSHLRHHLLLKQKRNINHKENP